jgi:hypothetical protein
MSNKLTTRKISELKDFHFLIPTYQRGYRWDDNQVRDLLKDVYEFQQNNNKEKDYCLQPIVVAQNEKGKYKVIDGQQRLTTIYLILKFLKAENFEISYENEKIDLKDLTVDTIDNHYLRESENKIEATFTSIANDNEEEVKNIMAKFENTLLNFVFVIWYDVTNEVEKDKTKEIEIFTRLNSGKIPLTNAELVKALFLQMKNFEDNIKVSQLQIATEWDRIEFALQDDAFWFFIHKNNEDYDTRIDYILELISGEKPDEKDNYATFQYFNEKFQDKKNLSDSWQEIKNLFLTLREWHHDHELHHKIGYLIACDISLEKILEKSENSKKTCFKNKLDELIEKTLQNIELQDIQYANGKISNVLLLHNIQTLINSKDKRNFFPFDKYYKDSWDIEHIHAIATNIFANVKKEDRIKWLKNNLNSVNEVLKKEKLNDEEFNQIIEDHFPDDNSLQNLCLLDSSTNRAYKNDSFNLKRTKLIEREKEGVFVPLCTKNIFMKHYSKNVKSLSLWNEDDRNAYLQDIKSKLETYLKPTENVQ